MSEKEVIKNEENNVSEKTEIVKEKNYSSLSMEELINELNSLCDNSNPYSVSKKAEEIKVLFYKLLNLEKKDSDESDIEEEVENSEEKKKTSLHPLEIEFKETNNRFRKNKSEYRKKRDKAEQKNLVIKQNIISEIDQLREEEESMKITFEKFRILQDQWKNTGHVPLSENNNLWQNYHHHVELFYDYIKINNELRDLDFKKNLEQKTLLCEKAEHLINEKNTNIAFDNLQELHEHWKNIGPVEREIREKIWERFQIASKKVNKKRNDYLHKKIAISKSNLNTKSDICNQISELTNSLPSTHNDWVKLTEKQKSLSEDWKRAAPIDKNDLKSAWSLLRDVNNTFFGKKNDFYKSRKEESKNHLKVKIDICEKAEKLATSTDWKNTSKKLISLQKDWQNSPFVQNNLSSDIWKRFRTACDTFFNARKVNFKKQDDEREENLTKKKSIFSELEKFKVSEDAKNDIITLKEFSNKWNKIGFVPIKSISINDKFNKLISIHYENLKLNKEEKIKVQFEAKVHNFNGNSDILNKEKEHLRNQIETLNRTILQYENNISFFGPGKSVEPMKNEILKKIEKSKSEIENHKIKLSTLNKI